MPCEGAHDTVNDWQTTIDTRLGVRVLYQLNRRYPAPWRRPRSRFVASRPERGAARAEQSALAAIYAKHDVTRRGFLPDRRGTYRAQAFAPPGLRKLGHCAHG